MCPQRITKVEVLGFRAFGAELQTFELDAPVAAIWGPNSRGKTSFAEALEFLLTGQIIRRQLTAGSQDEFADALRNAYLPEGREVFVQATVAAGDGTSHVLKRTLVADYSKRGDCQSTLTLDGTTAGDDALAGIGITLSQPPLRAPILAQHTLGYLFSASPTDRAVYFRALLEVGDLEELRLAVAGLDQLVRDQDSEVLRKLGRALAAAEAKSFLEAIETGAPTTKEVEQAFLGASAALLQATGVEVPAEEEARIILLEKALLDRRSRAFPAEQFSKGAPANLPETDPSTWEAVGLFLEERDKVSAEARRLTRLFAEALAIPSVATAQESIECPLCGTEDALTPTRVRFIEARVASSSTFLEATDAAKKALRQIETNNSNLRSAMARACPAFMTAGGPKRRALGFRVGRLSRLLGPEAEPILGAWFALARSLLRAHRRAARATTAVTTWAAKFAAAPDTLSALEPLKLSVGSVDDAFQSFKTALQAYAAEHELIDKLNTVLDGETSSTGWQEVIDLARSQKDLRDALIERGVLKTVRSELEQASKQIQKGNELVLNDKFQDLSGSVQGWWELLRPDEPTFFANVKPRPGAKRAIDFKAGLSTAADRSGAKLRDVIAVFSQSQLHCLGLALFIARAVHEGAWFIVLDDPILSSDEDYRPHFTASVVERLLDLGVQTILLTQDQKTWRDLEHRYLHKKIAMFQLSLEDPADGVCAENIGDSLHIQLHKISVLVRGGHPQLHKQAGEELRDAGERCLKEILVRNRLASGDRKAVISEYEGMTYGKLEEKVEPLLTKDPSHPGKLRAFGVATNPGKHDGDIPSPGVLKMALGDLKLIAKDYL